MFAGPKRMDLLQEAGRRLYEGEQTQLPDVGDVPMRSRFSLNDSIEDIEAYYKRVVAAGVDPIVFAEMVVARTSFVPDVSR